MEHTTWSLLFNVKKCNVLYFHPRCCHARFLYSYHLHNTQLLFHSDPGVVLCSDLVEWSDIMNIQKSRHAKFLDYLEMYFPLPTG